MFLVAKFRCDGVSDRKDSSGDKVAEAVYLSAVYSADPAHENYRWSTLTPAGTVNMQISNPEAFGAFEVGKEYLVTLVPA